MPVELGSLPLPLGLVTQGLTPQALALLDPAPLLVSFAAFKNQVEPVQEELLIAAGEEAAEGSAKQESSIFGFHLHVGQPLQLSMQVRFLQRRLSPLDVKLADLAERSKE